MKRLSIKPFEKELRSDETRGGLQESGQETSEGAAAIEKDEDHGRSRQGDQGQGSEIGDQVKINAHGRRSPMPFALSGYPEGTGSQGIEMPL